MNRRSLLAGLAGFVASFTSLLIPQKAKAKDEQNGALRLNSLVKYHGDGKPWYRDKMWLFKGVIPNMPQYCFVKSFDVYTYCEEIVPIKDFREATEEEVSEWLPVQVYCGVSFHVTTVD